MNHQEVSEQKIKQVRFRQAMKGLDKYGQLLDPLDARYDWLEMTIEEQVDGLEYLVAEQTKRKHITDQIREIIKYNTIPMVHDRITVLLDQLEGTT